MTKQALPTPGKSPVLFRVIAYLLERDETGRASYRTSLETFNGRDFLQDLREELLDGVQYLVGLEEEWETLHHLLSEAYSLLKKLDDDPGVVVPPPQQHSLSWLLNQIQPLLASSRS